jgi:hypothetical protein
VNRLVALALECERSYSSARTTRHEPRSGERSRLITIALVASLAGCAGAAPAKPPPPPVPLHLEPACDLAPAAGLSWIVEAEPRAIAQIPDLIPALAIVLPEERLKAFATSHGGVDLRQTYELCVARYRDSLLAVARVPVETERVTAAFDARSTTTATHAELAPNPRVVRATGTIDDEPERIVVFGREAVVMEQGKPGPLRAAEAFAFGKLKRAAPALRGAALMQAAQVLGPAPVRVFAPGPFEGESARALGGLIRAATAIGASARWAGRGSNVAVRVVVMGAWGDDAPAAAERLAAAAHVLSESPAGRLFGLQNPVESPNVHVEPDALVLEATIDGDALAHGVHDAVDAQVAEIMGR